MDVLDELRQEGREEGERIGERRGRSEGRSEGRVELLLKQLAARFGPVPAEAKARVKAATAATLDRWALRVLTAPSLQAVLGGAASGAKKAAPARRASRGARV